MEERNCEDKGV